MMSRRHLRIGVVGLGIAGSAAAALLARDGHQVEVVEEAPDPSPIGAGIWLQEYGQLVLERLGLLDDLAGCSRTVSQIRVVTWDGRPVVRMSYDAVPDRRPALGVHRGDLFSLLSREVRNAGAVVTTGATASAITPTADGTMITTTRGVHGPYDLVVGADGRNSETRAALGLAARVRSYEYGALWAIVDDPDGLASDASCTSRCAAPASISAYCRQVPLVPQSSGRCIGVAIPTPTRLILLSGARPRSSSPDRTAH